MNLATWNVLHRVHAVNWDEPVIGRWFDERARMASIADWLAGSELDVICLQEVSGDQLALLRDVVPGEIHAFAYPRVPAYYRRHEPAVLRDPTEYLVTIVRAEGATMRRGEAFESDAGKGFLVVEISDGTFVANAHVSYGDKHRAQIASIIEAAAAAKRVIVCGDFNADRETSIASLPDFDCVVPREPALATRPRADATAKSENIDHVFVRGIAIAGAAVGDGEGRSDHNPVVARGARPHPYTPSRVPRARDET